MFSSWQVTLTITIFLYGWIYSPGLIYIYFSVLLAHQVLAWITSSPQISIREKIRMATWGVPSESNILMKVEIDLTKAEAFLKKYNASHNERSLSLTHIALKSIAEGLSSNKNVLGKLIFGTLKRLDSVDINTLVDMGGKDLGQITLRNCDKIGLLEIRDRIGKKLTPLKRNECEDHKKKTALFK